MPIHYTPKTFLRQTSNDILQSCFGQLGVLFEDRDQTQGHACLAKESNAHVGGELVFPTHEAETERSAQSFADHSGYDEQHAH